MPTTILNATFDGVNPVATLFGMEPWNGGRINYYSEYEADPSNNLVSNVTLTGNDWKVDNMRFADEAGSSQLNLGDANGLEGRRIELLTLGYNSDVDLISTRVDYINGWEGALHDVTLGSANTRSVNLGAAQNLVTTGSGYVGNIETGGTALVTINGDVGHLSTNNSNDEVVISGGSLQRGILRGGDDLLSAYNDAFLASIDSSSGDNEIVLNDTSRINTVNMRNGDNALTLHDNSRISSMHLHDGNNTVTLLNDARILQLKLDRGTNAISTSDGNIETFNSHDASNTVTLGAGGVGQLKFTSNSMQNHSIISDGYVGSIQTTDSSSTSDDDQTTNVVLRNFAGSVQLGSGDDTVVTGDFFVEHINTSRGDDTVTIGSGGAGMVRLRDGNDTLYVIETTEGVSAQGNAGNDTLDFSLITSGGVTFTLASDGAWQETEAGWFQESGSMENIVGTWFGDTLTGDGGANRIAGLGGSDVISGGNAADVLFGHNGNDDLQGGKGQDQIFGGKGNDMIAGGTNHDILRGGQGFDVFIFGSSGGRDKVRDFSDGVDLLRIADHAGGFGTLGFADVGADRQVTYDGGEIVLENHAGTILTSSDFEFV